MLLSEIKQYLEKKEALEEIVYFSNNAWVNCSNFLNDFTITSITSPQDATDSSLTFLEKDKYANAIKDTKAKVILLRKEHLKYASQNAFCFICANPYLAMAYLTEFFAKPLFSETSEAKVGKNVQMAQNVTLGKGSEIGDNCVLCAGVVVGENVKIGANTTLFPNVCVYNDCEIGKNVRIHANSVIGSDGFGYAHTALGEHIKIYHNGKVVLEDDVEIGSNTSIDRAVFGETRIKKGVKIDNLVQIGHNCEIGEYSIIVSQCGISGSTTTGRNVVLGGQCGSAGHLHIGEFTQVGAKGAISKSLPPFGKFSGHPILPIQDWLKLQALLKKMVKKCN